MQDSWESMDVSTANILNRTTQAFYASQAESFSATRQSAWAGWQRVLADTGWEGEGAGGVSSAGFAGADGGASVGSGAGASDAAGVTGEGADGALQRGEDADDVMCADAEEARRHSAGASGDGGGTQRGSALRCGETEGAGASVAPVHRILDVACGNVRFKSFLESALPNATWDYRAVDACEQLVGAPAGVVFTSCDIVSALIEDRALSFVSSGSKGVGVAFVPGGSIGDAREDAPCEDAACRGAGSEGANVDLTVCFGFFHHVPGRMARERLLRALCAATVPGGFVAVSLWRFMDEPGLAKKTHESHAAALKYFAEQGLYLNLDANDYLLGWQQAKGIFRYCHHFDDEEVKALAASVSDVAQLTDCFRADGRTGNLNEYLVFRVR